MSKSPGIVTTFFRTLFLLASIALARIACCGSGDDSIPATCRDDGLGPGVDGVVSLSSNAGRDASAFCVEQDDASERGFFEGVVADESLLRRTVKNSP